MTQNSINDEHEPWVAYHDEKDKLTTTHSVIDSDGPYGLYNLAIELPNEELIPMMKLMKKEVDAQNRFSLTDGVIQAEFEMWDEDYSKRMYFCVDLTVKQAIKLTKQYPLAIGFIPVGKESVVIGAQKIFTINDLKDFIKIKMAMDAKPNKPHTWKVG